MYKVRDLYIPVTIAVFHYSTKFYSRWAGAVCLLDIVLSKRARPDILSKVFIIL